jgi:hypothetical protein
MIRAWLGYCRDIMISQVLGIFHRLPLPDPPSLFRILTPGNSDVTISDGLDLENSSPASNLIECRVKSLK